MSIISRARKGYAVYWERSGTDGYGKPTFLAPIEIRVRWDDVSVEFTGPNNAREFSQARVMVDREVPLGSMLLRGQLVDVYDITDPTNNAGAYEVRGRSATPNLRHTETLYMAFL